MRRAGENGFDWSLFGDAPRIHDDDLVTHLGDDSEIVGDEQNRHAKLALEGAQEIEDLRLDGDVERGGGLVGDEQGGIAGEGHRDDHALPHAAGELMRVFQGADFRGRDTHLSEHLDREAGGFGLVAGAMEKKNLGELAADTVDGIERGHWLLKNHADPTAPDAEQVGGCGGGEVGALEADFAAYDATGGLGEETENREGGDAFAAAGFADQSESAAARDGEADAIHGAEQAGVGVEGDGEVADFEERVGVCLRCHGRGAEGLAAKSLRRRKNKGRARKEAGESDHGGDFCGQSWRGLIPWVSTDRRCGRKGGRIWIRRGGRRGFRAFGTRRANGRFAQGRRRRSGR